MFLKFKGALLIFSLTICTLVSCVEDEKNPFENADGSETGEVFDVKLPGMGDFYVGTEIELRGNGFTAGDEIYVTNVDNSSLQALVFSSTLVMYLTNFGEASSRKATALPAMMFSSGPPWA